MRDKNLHADAVRAILYQNKDYTTFQELMKQTGAKYNSLRGCISYMRRKGWIEQQKEGKAIRFRLNERGRDEVIVRGAELHKIASAHAAQEDAALEKPACFQSMQQFKDWREAARSCREDRNNYCADCTPRYQTEMKQQRRCQYPYVRFVYSGGSDYTGIRRQHMVPSESLVPTPRTINRVDGIAAPKMGKLGGELKVWALAADTERKAQDAFNAKRKDSKDVQQTLLDE